MASDMAMGRVRTINVLLCDDEPHTLDLFTLRFERRVPTVCFQGALTVADGLAAIRSEPAPDVVFADLRIHEPDDGLDIVCACAARGIPCYVISAYISRSAQGQALLAHSAGIIQKPVRFEILETMLWWYSRGLEGHFVDIFANIPRLCGYLGLHSIQLNYRSLERDYQAVVIDADSQAYVFAHADAIDALAGALTALAAALHLPYGGREILWVGL